MARVSSPPAFIAALLIAANLLPACNSEILEKQAEQLKQQEAEIARQRKEIDDLLAASQARDQKQRDCKRAFSDYFEKAQASTDREQAISLYSEGLRICPDDEVAHYELGKAFADRGRNVEAEKEFEAALKIDPNFVDAKNQLDAMRKTR